MNNLTFNQAKALALNYQGWCKCYLIGHYVAYFKDGQCVDLYDPDVDDIRDVYNRIFERYEIRIGDIPVIDER